MAKICLEDTENNGMKLDIEGTDKDLSLLFANAFMAKDYLMVAATKALADVTLYKFQKENEYEKAN